MGRKKEREMPASIQAVGVRLAAWRRRRRGRERIPEELWAAAVGTAQVHGVYQVSRALGLDYAQLKKRAGRAEGAESEAAMAGAKFVEITGGLSERGAGCVVELEKGNGAKLRVSVSDGATVDWCRVKEAFLGA